MDNFRCHKLKGVKEAIQQTGAQLLYLPPYSPDFNPIEMMWSKLKAILRKAKTRKMDSLRAVFPRAFQVVSVSDITDWFRESGHSAFLNGIAVVI
jgi:transposase